MLRQLVAVGLLAVAAAPAVAQVDSERTSYSINAQNGWLGMGLECSRCTLTTSEEGEARAWTFSESPRVFSVDADGPADRAGLRIGDLLIAIDGVALTTASGGRAFAGIRPRQAVRLTYRRGGQERTARLVAGAKPLTGARELVEAARAMRLEHDDQERTLERSREQLERSRDQLERVRELLEQRLETMSEHRTAGDTAKLEELRRTLTLQEAALARAMAARSALETPDSPELTPEPPEPPVVAAAPRAPIAAAPPVVAVAPVPPAPIPAGPLSEHDWNRLTGPLRYSGRLGDVVIAVRGPGAVTTSQVTDTEVIITSGDMSVRLELQPRAAPRAARPAPAARPPRD
jgi:hypothetical protein